MADEFLDPIAMGFEILRRYKVLLQETLTQCGLRPDDIAEVLTSINVDRGLFLSLNRRYARGKASFRQFCADHGLAPELPDALGKLHRRLYVHQEEAIRHILAGETTILATGTGSGKTEAFLIPILNHCLKHPGPGVKALIIYPMNALADDQMRRFAEVTDTLRNLAPNRPIRLSSFTGSTSSNEQAAIRMDPPDILVTNYVMLDWMLTRSKDQPIFAISKDSLRYIVLDEIHTYRGNKASHLKYLLARLKARLTGPVVQVGTSATLQTDPLGGYLHSDDKRLDSFVKPLLGVAEYRFVTAQFEDEVEAPPDDEPLPAPRDEDMLGWALESDTTTSLENLSKLTGNTYSIWDLQGSRGKPSQIFQDMQRNRFVGELKRRLKEHGAQSFAEIARLLVSLVPPSWPIHRAEEVAKAYLSAIAFVNHLQAQHGEPLLDFRVHLFLRNIGGHLKRCIKCHKYHSGNQEYCTDCGYPLFYVYRDDIHQCIGKVSGNRLKWELHQESTDGANTYYVLVSSDAQANDQLEGPGKTLRFRDTIHASQDEIILDYDVYGSLHLRLLPYQSQSEVNKHLIPLVDGSRDYQYLHNLVRSVLDFQPRGRKKLLGFVDNREKATRYALVLQDEFASRFLEEYMRLCFREHLLDETADLTTVLEILHRHAPRGDACLPAEKELFEELDLWFWRYVCTPQGFSASQEDLLQLKEPGRFSDFER